MSGKRHKWWGYVKAVIRDYPEHCEALAALRKPSLTACGSSMPKGGGVGRPVEGQALRQLPAEDQREHDAVEAAVQMYSRVDGDVEKLRLIDMVFWARTHTLEGAAQALNVSYRTARRWHRAFIFAVAENLGLV